MDLGTISILASTAVGFLAPYLAKAGEASAKRIGEEVYQALKTCISNRSMARETLTDLEEAPEDPDRQAAFRAKLRRLLENDEAFAAQLQEVLKQAERTEAGATIIE